MITNYDSPYLRALRQNTCFIDPQALVIKNYGEIVKLSQKDITDYSCVMCYEVISDPKECVTCKTKFCSQCKYQLSPFFLGCPKYQCLESSVDRPEGTSGYMKKYYDLYLECPFDPKHCKFLLPLSSF